MALRLSTTLTDATSNPWTPTGETIIQGDFVAGRPIVEIETRVDSNAAWVHVTSIYLASERIVRLAQLPALRVTVRGNNAGSQLSIYDNE